VRAGRRKPDVETLLFLAREGCPICHAGARSDEPCFFWFFNESYCEPHTLDALEKSLGFCLSHAELLGRTTTGAPQLTTVFEILVRRVRRRLLLGGGGGDSRGPREPAVRQTGRCPVCQSRLDVEARSAFWLSGILDDPAHAHAYANPGLLCIPHLQLVGSQLPFSRLPSLLGIHRSAMAAAADALSELEREVERSPSEGRQDLVKALSPGLRLAVGHERDTGAHPGLDEGGPGSPRPFSIAHFLENFRSDACPVCLEVRRAWIEWVRWLDARAALTDDLEDLLPTCPDHVWAVVHRYGAFLALRASRRALGQALAMLDLAAGALDPPKRPAPRLTERLRESVGGPRRRLRIARQILLSRLECSVCDRLALARDRALTLLFALLEDPGGRTAFQSGHGLCLGHFARALEMQPPAEKAAVLAAVQSARLASLHWELEEAGRKSAWHFRPEGKGAEHTAGRRAMLRFSGSLGARWD
jgi:hypothetical protein